jgi:hypothetical protein
MERPWLRKATKNVFKKLEKYSRRVVFILLLMAFASGCGSSTDGSSNEADPSNEAVAAQVEALSAQAYSAEDLLVYLALVGNFPEVSDGDMPQVLQASSSMAEALGLINAEGSGIDAASWLATKTLLSEVDSESDCLRFFDNAESPSSLYDCAFIKPESEDCPVAALEDEWYKREPAMKKTFYYTLENGRIAKYEYSTQACCYPPENNGVDCCNCSIEITAEITADQSASTTCSLCAPCCTTCESRVIAK